MELKSGKNISNYGRPYIVAELNSSHNGKVEIAKEMVKAAKACGCDAVKFQSWSAESLYCQDYYEQNPIAKRMVGRFSLSPEKLLELASYCKESGIDFSSTPYSRAEVDFLVDKLDAPFVKIASMDINNLPYLNYVARKKVPIVLSTGMASIDEIAAAVRKIESTGNGRICILHCVSLYPVDAQSVNLNNIVMLRELFPKYAVGYSDHTLGSEVACAATALGAAMIEKHFTLDNKRIGWDNQMATEPGDMKALVERCHRVYESLGQRERCLSSEELAQRGKMRRSLVAASDLPAGHVLKEEDLDAKRPGDGIPVDAYRRVIGKGLSRAVKKDQMIFPSYLTGKGSGI